MSEPENIKPVINEPASDAKPLLELKMLLVGPGVMVSNNVAITDVAIKDLLSYPALHPELVQAAQIGTTILAQQYNGIQPGNDPLAKHKADITAEVTKAA